MAKHQLAQINIARILAPLDSPQMADFMNALDEINTLAEAAPGFVWRLKGDNNNATDYRPFDDDWLLVNMSVWSDVDSLKAYTYRSAHVDYLRRKKEWFEALGKPYLALWWVVAGHVPTIEEAKARLASLEQNGETQFAFTFKHIFSPPEGESLSSA
jgi:hypothetical protein